MFVVFEMDNNKRCYADVDDIEELLAGLNAPGMFFLEPYGERIYNKSHIVRVVMEEE